MALNCIINERPKSHADYRLRCSRTINHRFPLIFDGSLLSDFINCELAAIVERSDEKRAEKVLMAIAQLETKRRKEKSFSFLTPCRAHHLIN